MVDLAFVDSSEVLTAGAVSIGDDDVSNFSAIAVETIVPEVTGTDTHEPALQMDTHVAVIGISEQTSPPSQTVDTSAGFEFVVTSATGILFSSGIDAPAPWGAGIAEVVETGDVCTGVSLAIVFSAGVPELTGTAEQVSPSQIDT
jgi:hypothetical protein